jgi:hypothetical protein
MRGNPSPDGRIELRDFRIRSPQMRFRHTKIIRAEKLISPYRSIRSAQSNPVAEKFLFRLFRNHVFLTPSRLTRGAFRDRHGR